MAYGDVLSDDAVFVMGDDQGDVLNFSRREGDFEWTGPACVNRNDLKFTSGNVYNQLEEYLPMRGIHIRAQDIDTYQDYERAIEFVRSWKL